MRKSLAFYWILFLLAASFLFVLHKIYPHETGTLVTIDSDGKGYYAYLPAIFDEGNIGQLEPDKAFTNQINGRNFIKYPFGTALLISPFYAIALLLSSIFSIDSNSTSLIFQLAVQAAGLFYSLFGIWFFGKILSTFQISGVNTRLTQVVLFFGTNLFYYSLFTTSLSHIYSFAAIAAFLYFARSFFIDLNIRHFNYALISLAIVLLIRPFNILIVLAVPFIAESYSTLINGIKLIIHQKKSLAPGLFLFLIIVSLQPLLWYVQTGNWVIWSYSNEGFYFRNPKIMEVLVGFRKGLFVYTPILLLMIPGLWVLKKKSSFSLWSFLFFFAVLAYFIASWWNWYFGDGFGHRAFIDYYALFATVIALGLNEIKSKNLKYLVLGIASLLIGLNLVQSFQYKTDILHHHNMDFNKYSFTFLKTGKEHRNLLGGMKDISPYSTQEPVILISTSNTFEKEQANWEVALKENIANDKSPQNQAVVFNENEFGLMYSAPTKELKLGGRLWVEASLRRLELEKNSSAGCELVVAKKDSTNSIVFYSSFVINDLPAIEINSWDSFNYSFEIAGMEDGETLDIYLWNKEKGHFAIDDFNLAIYRFE